MDDLIVYLVTLLGVGGIVALCLYGLGEAFGPKADRTYLDALDDERDDKGAP